MNDPSAPDGARIRLVILASGAGSTMQAVLDAAADQAFPAEVVAVGSDVFDAQALHRASRAGVATFCVPMRSDRAEWDLELTARVAAHEPDLVLTAGFMRLLGPAFLAAFAGRCVNSHPALSPSFPGTHAPRDAIGYGVKVSGCTLFLVDAGVDTGLICAQRAVVVNDDDTVESLHERIKVAEREMLVTTIDRMARTGWTVTDRKVTLG